MRKDILFTEMEEGRVKQKEEERTGLNKEEVGRKGKRQEQEEEKEREGRDSGRRCTYKIYLIF